MARVTRTAPFSQRAPEGDSATELRVGAGGTADDPAIDAAAIRRWFARAHLELAAHSAQIDALNVFPVADRDTGSNLLLTWDAACAALPPARNGESLADVLGPAARGALRGARGNSGAVLCQVLYGLASALDTPSADGPGIAAALATAAAAARTALAEPVEGTIVTVALAAADSAVAAGDVGTVAVLGAAEEAARAALAATTGQLRALREAGVVDAGASGFVVVLAALHAAVQNSTSAGERPLLAASDQGGSPRHERTGSGAERHGAARPAAVQPDPLLREAHDEVQYLLAAAPEAIATLRATLIGLGDSVAIAGGPDLWHVHVHTAEIGPVVEAGIAAGQLSRLEIARLDVEGADDHSGFSAARALGERLVLAVAPGDGLARLFATAGAHPLTFSSRPDSHALRDAMAATGANQLVLLPNDAHLVSAGQQAASELRELGYSVVVVPTRSPVQGLAALAVADPHMPLADEVVVMADAAGATRVGELSVATLTAVTSAGTCAPGDVLAMQAGDVVLVGPTLFDVACHLLDRLLEGGGELVTLVTGVGAPPDLSASLTTYLESTHPFANVTVYDGGQPTHPLLVGVE